MELSHKLIEEICRLAIQAGERIMRIYGGEISVTLKKDASPLTEADRVSHEFLVDQLTSLMPNLPVISEESHEAAAANPAPVGWYWLIDPLDGTKEFLKRTNEFTVNVALIEGSRPRLGVVHAPALDLTYYAAQGLGAWRRQGGNASQPIQTRPAPASSLAVVASKDHAGPLVTAMLARLKQPTLKAMGSSLKFCLVAEGKADIYLRDLPTMEWDTAAAQCVVEVAGGTVCALDGQPLRYGKPGLKNPSIMTVGDPKLDWRKYIASPPSDEFIPAAF
jgi:3'(2'), 5'-bisphosphate nucleotidase